MSDWDLRQFLATLESEHPREILSIDEPLSAAWELAACTVGLEKKLRVPTIRYTDVRHSAFPVIHNVCSSLARIARVLDCSVNDLEASLAGAYEVQIEPEIQSSGPVRECVYTNDEVDLLQFPDLRYSRTQTHAYISAATVVARDPVSGALNTSFHRLMIRDANTLTIYMTPGGDLDCIFQHNRQQQRDTPVAAYIGAHPLWSLGSLAAGPLELDDYGVIGGLLGVALPVVRGMLNEHLLIPARAEIAVEGYLCANDTASEGPYGEAFGFVSETAERPVFKVRAISHRENPLFQDIVPGQIEHMTMTSIAIKVHLQKHLAEQFPCIEQLHLPAPMTAYIAVQPGTPGEQIDELLRTVLQEQRFLKHAVVFDNDVKLDNAKQTQRAIAMHVQAGKHLVMLPEQQGNGLDPSERGGKTDKWGIDATASTVSSGEVAQSALPEAVVSRIDIDAILKRAQPPRT